MHSQLALTEHLSLNLAPLILLNPVVIGPNWLAHEPERTSRFCPRHELVGCWNGHIRHFAIVNFGR